MAFIFKNKVFIYGFDAMHVVKAWQYVDDTNASDIGLIKYLANRFIETKPDIKKIYILNDYYGLKKDFDESIHSRLDDFAKHYEFEDLVARKGICIYSGDDFEFVHGFPPVKRE